MYVFLKDFLPSLAVIAALLGLYYTFRSARLTDASNRRNILRQLEVTAAKDELALRRERMAFLIMFDQRLVVAGKLLKIHLDTIDNFSKAAERTSGGAVIDLRKIPVTWIQVESLLPIGETSGIAAIEWKDLTTLDISEQRAVQIVDMTVRGCDSTLASMKFIATEKKLMSVSDLETLKTELMNAADAILQLTERFNDAVEKLAREPADLKAVLAKE